MSAVAYRVRDRVTGIQSWVCYIHCDAGRCPARINGRAREARRVASANGWQVGPPNDYCPEHRRGTT